MKKLKATAASRSKTAAPKQPATGISRTRPVPSIPVPGNPAPRGPLKVNVVNSPSVSVANKVPVSAEQSGTWEVGITGTPTFGLSTSANTVQSRQDGPWAVDIKGKPEVSIAGTLTVKVSNFPSAPSSVSAARQAWEYQVFIKPTGPDTTAALQNTLNELGAQGWEMAGMDDYIVLKRPR